MPGVVIMERTVIRRSYLRAYGAVALASVAAMAFVIIALQAGLDKIIIMILSGLILLSAGAGFFAYQMTFWAKDRMIVIDHNGLTVNDSIMLGPIPWDCISDAKVSGIKREKQLTVYITNISKLESVFGEEAIHNKVSKNQETGERLILMNLYHCGLHGIDLEALIKERARSRAD